MMGYWGGNMMGGWGYGYGNGTYWWVGLIVMALQLVFWAAIAYFVVRLFRSHGRDGYDATANNALEILRQRYAKGEIDTEEYLSRKRELLN